jgi:hypothetical protein
LGTPRRAFFAPGNQRVSSGGEVGGKRQLALLVKFFGDQLELPFKTSVDSLDVAQPSRT